jgi:hypothetical protein
LSETTHRGLYWQRVTFDSGAQSFLIKLGCLVQVLAIYFFAFNVIIVHKFSVLIIASIFHELEQIFIPISVGNRGRLKQAFYIWETRSQNMLVHLGTFLANVDSKGDRSMSGQIRFAI